MITRLSKAELEAIEREVEMLAGPEPDIEHLAADGITEQSNLIAVLDAIRGAGRVITLLVAEMIQSAAALIIAVVFAAMEYQRVEAGALALGQDASKAALIAFAVVVANVVHPIYSLRELRGQNEIDVHRPTLRGYMVAFWGRITGQPTTTKMHALHNPTLHIAAAVITWSTVFLAVYDILAPLLTEILTNTITRPVPIVVMELIMGLGLSIAGVFFLQSAAHEIGVRTLTDQPQRITDVLAARRAEHAARVESIRADVRDRAMAAKLADAQRKESARHNADDAPFGSNHHDLAQVVPVYQMSKNGNGNGNGNGDGGTHSNSSN